ncbi:putative mitochondrial protein [Phytophthora cinnamomi]|uniref:putative mitochondrial protein n=1 Tax=Phytophthora cinnamomi TaxID=4785 RepID=UPI00355A69F7|nr:putative mitochondrial protein [Phytophthora cinnamomi]
MAKVDNTRTDYLQQAEELEQFPQSWELDPGRKWRVPAKHGDVPNAYVRVDKEAGLDIFIRVPQGMEVMPDVLDRLGVTTQKEVVLELKSRCMD